MRLAIRSMVVSCALVFAAIPAHATPIDVRVLSSRSTATVTVGLFLGPLTTKSSTGSDPVSESLSQTYCENEVGNLFECDGQPPLGSFVVGDVAGNAAADWLEVSAYGNGGAAPFQGRGVAEADSEWTFSPLVDGIATIDILGSNDFIEAWQSASLFDLTANEPVWQFISIRYDLGISQTVPTLLSAEHIYVMHLNAYAGGQGDTTSSTLRVSGIRAVPDNVDSLVCLCIGVLFALLGKQLLA